MLPVPSRVHSEPDAQINVVPYIDVMLVLLVIFMITTPILEQGVEIDLPEAESAIFDKDNLSEDNLPMVITINKKGLYSIGERENLSANRIIAAIKAAQSFNPNHQVMIKGDKEVVYDKIIELLTHLQSAGVKKVGLVTKSVDKR